MASLQKFINLSNYPIDQPSNKLSIVIDQVRSDLEKDGCAIIRGFLSKEGVSELIKETTSVAHYAHHSSALTNLSERASMNQKIGFFGTPIH